MSYYVYMVSNVGRTVLYIGVTNNLVTRVSQHRAGVGSKFTARYNCKHLVFYEEYNDIYIAIAREKQLKNWKREWKETLIKTINPTMADLSESW